MLPRALAVVVLIVAGTVVPTGQGRPGGMAVADEILIQFNSAVMMAAAMRQ